MKKRFFTIASLLLSSSIYAQDINITTGWQLKGTETGFANMSDFDNTCINTVWSYDSIEKKWKAYSSNEITKQLITNSLLISELENININDGFWISANSNCTINTSDINSVIIHNGIIYNTVTSTFTNKVWLDRNLGANQVCTSLDDENCYGDYYQWGRDADGHEKYNSNTTNIQAINISSVGSNFIMSTNAYNYDWAINIDHNGSLRSNDWSKIDGSSICPIGFRVPTKNELKLETTENNLSDKADAFNSFLKLASAGDRRSSDALVVSKGLWGTVWSTSINQEYSSILGFSDSSMDWYDVKRARGLSVRCIKD